jgi:phage shock protein A
VRFFPRTRDIVVSRVEEIVAAAPDGGLTIRLVIKDIEEALIETRGAEARLLHQARDLDRKIVEADQVQQRLTDEARRALASDREDLARRALSEKYESLSLAAELGQRMGILEAKADGIAVEVQRLEAVLSAAKAWQPSEEAGQDGSSS